uniref:Uncharacterized protein n=1 Tax=Salix viminalis TaxID=40686 RepID=A0A6N2ME29_SALVM
MCQDNLWLNLTDGMILCGRIGMELEATTMPELDQNTNYDWNRIEESGQDMEPIFGPGYTRLVNSSHLVLVKCCCEPCICLTFLFPIFFSGSCYMAATMQVVFSTRSFNSRLVYIKYG